MELPESTIPGFIWAYQFDPDARLSNRLPLDISLEELTRQKGCIWLHLGLTDARVPAFLETIPDLDEDARLMLTRRNARETLTTTADVLYGTLVDFQRGFDELRSEIGWLHFAVTERFIITTRLKPLRSMDQARIVLEKSSRIRRPLDILTTLVTEFQRTVLDVVLETNETLNDIEDSVYDESQRDKSEQLVSARRMIIRLNRHLRTELALFRRVAAADEEDQLPGLEHSANKLIDRIETVERDVSSLQERARLLREDMDARAAAQTNRHLYILSVLTAFFMPPALVTGFFGMNTDNLPFAHNSAGTFFALILIVSSIGFAWWLLKKAHIL